MKGRPSIRDVAREAGVSATLASFALNDRAGVSAATRERILEAADRLGYRADPFARALRTGTANAYGLMIRNMANPFFLDVLRGAQDAATEQGATILAVDSEYSPEREREHVDLLLGQRVRGLAIAPVGPGEAVSQWLSGAPGRATVVINAVRPPDLPVTCVSPDNKAAVRLAVDHLADLGHRRISFLTAPAGLMADNDRLVAFEQRCSELGIEPDPIHTRLSLEHVHSAVSERLAKASRPTAVITNSDFTAHAVYRAAREAGIAVGEELSVVGHDDLPTSELLAPGLTTIRLDRLAIGRAIFARLADTELVTDHVEPVELIRRSSTGPAPR
ncbi:LacI family DNA-binding transcriptional regulator [Arthrobacter sp. Helios]|uniref:LacI family DNA-binding transcriptional regulator n=1 Tax=Arthrobacter sp. Helios TaxID=2828862 RepID=UPI00204C261D|nr:LacI family DNA-binding transcriptional regulator [Arthrobacter sp. Helios]UPO76168.1 LacI family transcriptional regulator [Arthrobacter sp. Helios]